MKYFKYDGPPGQLVGFGVVGPGLVVKVVDSLAYLVAQNADFTELAGDAAKKAEASAVLVSPDGPAAPGTQDAPSEPAAKAKAADKTPVQTPSSTSSEPSDLP